MAWVVQKGGLGETVRDFALSKGISISSLERSAGYSPGMISRWIAAGPEDYFSLSKLVALADLLEVSLDELVGRQREALPKKDLNNPASRLKTETCAGQLTWSVWQPDDKLAFADSLPPNKSSRPCCGGWWTQREELKFLIAVFCDDIDDEEEPLELGLYYTPGHKLPLFPVPETVADALPDLYAQILYASSFASGEGTTDSTVLPFNAQNSKTIAFRCSSG